jgi:transposase-like protein
MRKRREGCGQGWIDVELVGCEFSDVRLNKRFRKLVEQFSGGIGASIPWACQDWANTKAAYRFLSNPQVNEAEILQGHLDVLVQGLHRIQVRDDRGEIAEAVLEIRYRRIRVLPPIGKQKQYPDLKLTVIHVQERGTPRGRDKIDSKLITNLPVTSRRDALEKIRWYSQRWKIET